MGTNALIVGVQNIPRTLVSNCMAIQTGGMNYRLERNKMLLHLSAGIPGRAAIATTDSHLSLIPLAESSTSIPDQGNCGYVFFSSRTQHDDAWIIDSGATDHMTYDPDDFSSITQPRRTCIANANGATYPVTGAGTVPLSPSLSLSHTLLVPSLSNKLMSVSQVTEELNCVVLIYSTFCLLQDVLSKEIIGRGTKRGDCITWMTSA
jgi:hypothetical protein